MRFSSRSKMSTTFSLLLLTVLVGAFAFYSSTGKTSAHATTSASTFKGLLGTAEKVAQVNPKALGKSATTNVTKHVMPMHARPASNSGVSTTTALRQPSVQGNSKAPATLLHNFDGVNAIQNSQATGGYDLEPPDESMAVGGDYVLNFVNLTGAIYNKQGAIVAGPFPLGLVGGGGFFNTDLSNIVSDPRAYYDQASHTWFALVWEDDFVNGLPGPAYVDLAVNAGNPVTSPWTIYKIDVSDPTAAGCPCLPDFTILGIDQYNVYLVPNEFQNFGAGGFNGSQIYVLAKSQLIAGVAKPNVVHFGSLSVGGVITYHLQPAVTHGSAPAEYFMNSLDPNNTYDNRLGVWAMTNRDKVAQGVIPALSATVIQSEAYALPPNAQTPPGYNVGLQFPTTGVVQSDFDALQEVQYINGHLYGALDTSLNIAGDSGARAGIAWFDVTPSLSGGAIGSKTKVADQGYVSMQGLYLLYPHIEANANGTAAIVFSYGGPGTYLSAAYVVRSHGGSFGSVHTAASGAAPDNGFTGTAFYGGAARWGDYSAGQLDPSGNGIWFATQYIAGTGDQYVNWSNRIFEIQG